MTTHNPILITIKILAHTPPFVKGITEDLSKYGSVMHYEATPLTLEGNSLVPAPVSTAGLPAAEKQDPPKAAPKEKPKVKSTPKLAVVEEADVPKTITFAAGSDPEKIWHLLRDGPAATSTQIREKLGLGSNIVNTTIYRLKKAGMVRPMSYNAPNGDTLYTGTNLDPVPKAGPVSDIL